MYVELKCYFVPDVKKRSFPDPKIYIFVSRDQTIFGFP